MYMQNNEKLVHDLSLLNKWVLYLPIILNIILITIFIDFYWFKELHISVLISVTCLIVYLNKIRPLNTKVMHTLRSCNFKKLISKLLIIMISISFFLIYYFLTEVAVSIKCGPFCFNSETIKYFFALLGVQFGMYFICNSLLISE